ncbi:MAG: uracil-DNA glycosylase [Alphaproteobacteria bacterium]|nr:uracil-DNA glycosylase [Alphaproteobacteria bacterium]
MAREQDLATLAWLVEMGADEAIAAEPVDRLADRSIAVPAIIEQAPATAGPVPTAPTIIRQVPTAAITPPAAPEAAASAQARAAAARSLAELEAVVRSFDGCSLKTTATNTVFADGVPGARVMFVGEAPGADEDRLGRPFVGASGQLLDRMVAWIGLDRAKSFYIANVIYWRPPGNRTPTTAEVAICLPFIRRQIELAAPEVLVFLGASAAHALLGTTGAIGRLRGRWLDYASPGLTRPVKALATFHPAYLLRSPSQKRESWRDLLMIKNKLGG